MPPSFSSDCILAMQAAFVGGSRVLRHYMTDASVENKADGSPVTIADLESQRAILPILQTSSLPILSEESAEMVAPDAAAFWIVDPLDGTNDFIGKTGEFAIHVALCRNGDIVTGVVYQPVTDTWYVAEKGRGAFRKHKTGQWERLYVSKTVQQDAIRYVVSRHHLSREEKDLLHRLNAPHFVQKGSAGVKMSAIAEGSADAYFFFSYNLRLWDTAPGYCLVTEAGGKVTNMLGEPLRYTTEALAHDNGVLVTNGNVHDMILRAYRTKII